MPEIATPDNKLLFDTPEQFFKVMAHSVGERHDIDAVSSPLIYTDIEDKIEQLRERINNLETCLSIMTFQLTKLTKEAPKWRKKQRKSRKRLS
jgi:hypothetical protein